MADGKVYVNGVAIAIAVVVGIVDVVIERGLHEFHSNDIHSTVSFVGVLVEFFPIF